MNTLEQFTRATVTEREHNYIIHSEYKKAFLYK